MGMKSWWCLAQQSLQHELATDGVVRLSPTDRDLLDVLIGQTAVALGMPLHSSIQRHYGFFPGRQTVQPYTKPYTKSG